MTTPSGQRTQRRSPLRGSVGGGRPLASYWGIWLDDGTGTCARIRGKERQLAHISYPCSYDARFREVWDGVGLAQVLDGRRASAVAPFIERAVAELDGERNGDFWDPTAGNARHALVGLLDWSERCPDAVFRASVHLMLAGPRQRRAHAAGFGGEQGRPRRNNDQLRARRVRLARPLRPTQASRRSPAA